MIIQFSFRWPSTWTRVPSCRSFFPNEKPWGFPHVCYRKKRSLINNVLLVKIDGPDWYTIYHHRNLLLKGFLQPPLFSTTNQWEFGTSMPLMWLEAPSYYQAPVAEIPRVDLFNRPGDQERLQERLLVVGLVAVWVVLRWWTSHGGSWCEKWIFLGCYSHQKK